MRAASRHDLVERRVDEVGELDLGDRQQAVHRHPDRDADDRPTRRAACRSRGCSPNSSMQPAVTRNTPPRAPTSSPRSDDPVVGRHLVVQRVVDRGDDVLLGHRAARRRPVLGEHVAQGGRRRSGSGGVPRRRRWRPSISRLDLGPDRSSPPRRPGSGARSGTPRTRSSGSFAGPPRPPRGCGRSGRRRRRCADGSGRSCTRSASGPRRRARARARSCIAA